jgi:hypothetical protein
MLVAVASTYYIVSCKIWILGDRARMKWVLENEPSERVREAWEQKKRYRDSVPVFRKHCTDSMLFLVFANWIAAAAVVYTIIRTYAAQDEELTQLGERAEIPASPAAAKLETVGNPKAGVKYLVRFTCPEFTCLCPVTGQPDFAHFVIDYVPDARLLESKSSAATAPSTRTARSRLRSGSRQRRSRRGSESAATGTPAAASPSTCSTSRARRRTDCGSRTPASRPTAGGGK